MGQGESITKFELPKKENDKEQNNSLSLSHGEENEVDSDSVVIKRQYHMLVLVNPYDSRCSVGCAGKLLTGIVIHDDMLPIRSLYVEFNARDQGHGTIGYTKVVLMTQDQQKQMKRSHHLVTLTRIKTKTSLTIESTNRILEELVVGDTIGVWAICQDEPGNQCAVEDCLLIIRITRNWFRRKNALLFLYSQKFLKFSKSIIYQERIDSSSPSPLSIVFSNHDLCRKIVKYL